MQATLQPPPLAQPLGVVRPTFPLPTVSKRAVIVWSLWAAAVWWTGDFVARHGHNIPANDEWAFVPVSYASFAEQFRWLGGLHMEHRFPVARFFFMALLQVTGHDYRAGMWMSLGLLAGAAAALMLAARRLRGYTALADAVFPLLLLHPGHTENLLMGYQIAFTITVFALGVFLLVVVKSPDTSPDRSALRGAACLLVIAGGGWLGLVFVPAVWAWVAWQARRATGERGRRRLTGAILLAVALYLAWSAAMLGARPDGVEKAQAAGLDARIRSVAEVTAIGLGPGLSLLTDLEEAGWILLGIQAVTAIALAWVGLRRAEARPVAWGLLAVLLGVWVFAVGIGYSRGNGLASRYTSFTALGVALPFLALARFAPRPAWPLTWLVLAAGILLAPKNAEHAGYQGAVLDQQYESIVADARSGMPLDVLADRHVDFWLDTPPAWRSLWEHRSPLLRDVPPPVEKWDTKPATFRRDGERTEQFLSLARYRVELGGTERVSILRVKFKPGSQTTWEPMAFEWTDPASGQKRRSEVRPWVRPLEQTTVFWIDGPLASGELLMGRAGCPIDVLAVEYSTQFPVRK